MGQIQFIAGNARSLLLTTVDRPQIKPAYDEVNSSIR